MASFPSKMKWTFFLYGLFIAVFFIVPTATGHEREHFMNLDFNFWIALFAATGVPAFAWWMVRSSITSVKKNVEEALKKVVTCDSCKVRQMVCQRETLEKVTQVLSGQEKDLEGCIENLREKKEMSHQKIFEEIKLNREKVFEQLTALRKEFSEALRALALQIHNHSSGRG